MSYKFEHLFALKNAFDAVTEVNVDSVAQINEQDVLIELSGPKPKVILASSVVEKMGGVRIPALKH